MKIHNEHDPLPRFVAVTEDEFLRLAQEIRPFTEQRTRIEVAPWIQDYVVDMDELYSELIVETMTSKLKGPEYKKLESYQQMFEAETHSGSKSVKILGKGNPGMGKTTLAKKIAFDWAKGFFTKFAAVFFLFLKLVKPDTRIERILLEQNPWLEGLNVSEQKLRKIVETYGSRCLLILDGLDEHAFGSNEDVMKIIQGRKLLHCNLLVTSRPHTMSEIKHNFQVITRINGFTRDEARKFASKILQNPTKVEAVLSFNPANFQEDLYLHQCPILLSFMCILVSEDESVDLTSRSMETGEIYARMVKCLYKKFTLRKGIENKLKDLMAVLRSVGKLALKTLQSRGEPLLQRSDVIKEVGEDAFDHGLLIGNEDFGLRTDTSVDVLITFPHRSIQEFLGAFFFILSLSEGISVDTLLGVPCHNPVFMTNPLFFQFCLWFCNKSSKHFENQMDSGVVDTLKAYMVGKLDSELLDLNAVKSKFPILDLEKASEEQDYSRLTLIEDVLFRLLKPKQLALPDHSQSHHWQVAARLVTSALELKTRDNVSVVQCGKASYGSFSETGMWSEDEESSHAQRFAERVLITRARYLRTRLRDWDLHLSGDGSNARHLVPFLVGTCAKPGRDISVFAFVPTQDEAVCLPDLMHHEEFALHIIKLNSSMVVNAGRRAVPECPKLRSLSIGHVHDSVIHALVNAKSSGKLPALTHLNLIANNHFSNVLVGILFAEVWVNLKGFSLCSGSKGMQGQVTQVLKDGKIPNLEELSLYLGTQDPVCIGQLGLESLQQLQALTLHRCQAPVQDLCEIPEVLQRLKKLELNHSSGGAGKLGTILKEALSALEVLVLADCGLVSIDLKSLAEAEAGGRLLRLRHLDVSHNNAHAINLFHDGAQWNKLLSLNVNGLSGPVPRSHPVHVPTSDLDFLFHQRESGCMKALQEVRVATVCDDTVVCWKGLQRLEIASPVSLCLGSVVKLVEAGKVPALKAVTVITSLGLKNIQPRGSDRSRNQRHQKDGDALSVKWLGVDDWAEAKLEEAGVTLCVVSEELDELLTRHGIPRMLHAKLRE